MKRNSEYHHHTEGNRDLQGYGLVSLITPLSFMILWLIEPQFSWHFCIKNTRGIHVCIQIVFIAACTMLGTRAFRAEIQQTRYLTKLTMVDSMTQGFVLASKVLNSRIKQPSGPVEVHKIHHIYSFSYNIRCKILVKE